MALHVFVPTRSRPASMLRLTEAFENTCLNRATHLHWIVDSDDPELSGYRDAFSRALREHKSLWIVPPGPPGIVHPLNFVVRELFQPGEDERNGCVIDFVGFMGDDHLPRTKNWDDKLTDELRILKTGIVYGDDLFQHERLPTAAFMTANIPDRLGFMAPNELRHLYVDDYWKDLGNGIGKLLYYPEVVIEHLHYLNSKSIQDETYERNNNARAASADRAMYLLYKSTGKLNRDIAAVRELI